MAFLMGMSVWQTTLGMRGYLNFRSSPSTRPVEVSKPKPTSSNIVRTNSGDRISPVAALRATQSHGWSSSSSSRPAEVEFGVHKSSRDPKGSLLGAVRAGPESATPVKPSKSKKRYPGEMKGFVEEMRFVAMKLHTKDQSKEGEKEDKEVQPVAKWEPTLEGYLRFLVNSKKVYDTLEEIVASAAHPSYAEFRDTGLERSAKLAKDLDWFQSQGHEIPPVGEEGTKYAELLKGLSETDPPAFICHFYNVYFAHSAGGKFIGQKVAEKVIDGKVLEFYKWDGDLQTLLANVKAKLNKVAENWSREEKDHCLEETELSFKYSGKLLRLIVT